MKTYSNENVAKCQASKAHKFNSEITYVQDGDVFLVGTFDEITAYITEREAGAKKAKAAATKVAKTQDVEYREMTFTFNRETAFWLVADVKGKEAWFEKASLKAYNVVAELKTMVITASTKYFEKKMASM